MKSVTLGFWQLCVWEMELTPKWLDAESVKPNPGRIVCVRNCDGLIGYGWTTEKVSEEGEAKWQWKDPYTEWWISLYELKRLGAWHRVAPQAVHYLGPDSEWRVIAWQAGAEGMPAKGEQVLVRLGSFLNFRHYGTGVARLARVGDSDNEYYDGFLNFVLEEPCDRGLEWPDSVKQWAYLPGET